MTGSYRHVRVGTSATLVALVLLSCARRDVPPKQPESPASAVRDTPRADSARTAKASFPDAARPDSESDSEGYSYADRLTARGLLLRDSEDPSSADFHFAWKTEEETDLEALGLFAVSILRDSAAKVELINGERHAMNLVVNPKIDSVLRKEIMQECPPPIPVTLDMRSSLPSWNVGLRVGAVAPVRALNATVSDQDRDIARRLVESLPVIDAPVIESFPPPEQLFARVPHVLTGADHFRDGSLELLVVSSRRRAIHVVITQGMADSVSVGENIFLIAERPLGSDAPFTIAFSNRKSDLASDVPELFLLQAVQAGRPARLTLLVSASGQYVQGGDFMVRGASGKWKVIAYWANGCD